MGCLAAKSLHQYEAVLCFPTGNVRSSHCLESGLVYPITENHLVKNEGKRNEDSCKENREISYDSQVILPFLSINPQLSSAKVRAPIMIAPSTIVQKESQKSSSAKSKKIGFDSKFLKTLVLPGQKPGQNSIKKLFSTNGESSSLARITKYKNNVMNYSKPINLHNLKYLKKPTKNRIICKQDNRSDSKLEDLSLVPSDNKKNHFRRTFNNFVKSDILFKLSSTRFVDERKNTLCETSKNLDIKVNNNIKTRVSSLSMENHTKHEIHTSRTSLNQNSLNSCSTGLPLAHLKFQTGSFQKKRPSLCLSPKTRIVKINKQEKSMLSNGYEQVEVEFAEKFRQARISIEETQRHTKNFKQSNPGRFSTGIMGYYCNRGSKLPTNKTQNIDLMDAYPLESQATATRARNTVYRCVSKR